ncbi:MAG: hypothetical protein EOM20_13490 [Spartobacteria bacterium]|nr:hypothetical protein [Spartobacteria bacterium]
MSVGGGCMFQVSRLAVRGRLKPGQRTGRLTPVQQTSSTACNCLIVRFIFQARHLFGGGYHQKIDAITCESMNKPFSNGWKKVENFFQSLEKTIHKFPMIGKMTEKVSNHWKLLCTTLFM